MSKPLYIALEGIKGSGKSTLIDLLKRKLEITGIPNDWYNPFRKPIEHCWQEELLKLELSEELLDQCYNVAYANRACIAAQKVDWHCPLIIGDRSIITSYATRLHKHINVEHAINTVNASHVHVPVPNAVILLDTPVKVASSRIENRKPRAYGHMHETKEALQQHSANYMRLAREKEVYPLSQISWYIINANASPRSLSHRIWNILIDELNIHHKKNSLVL